MRNLATALVLALVAAPAPVLAADAAPAAAPEAAKAAKPKLLCRPLPARTGSHRPQGRVCKTAEEWKIRDRDIYMDGRMEDTTKVEPAGPKI